MHTRRPSSSDDTELAGRPWLLLAAVAAVLVVSQGAMARLSPDWSQASFQRISDVIPVVALLALPALAAVAAAPLLSRLGNCPPAVWVMLATGLAMRVVWYGVPIAIDDDYWRYLWDGAVVAAGGNPYAIAPKAVADGDPIAAHLQSLAAGHAEVLQGINFPELKTIYPATAQAGFALANLIAPFSLDGLRLVFLAAEIAALAVIVEILRSLGRAPLLAALYWCNPLVVWSSHGTIHSEALMAPLLLGTCLAAWRGRDLTAAVLLALAVGVKLWPVLLLPLLARLALDRGRGRELVWPAVAFSLTSALVLAPLAISAMTGGRSGLVAYSDHWWVNNAPFAWISRGMYDLAGGSPLGQRLLRGAIALLAGAVALLVAWRPPRSLADLLASATAVAAVTFYLAPAQFPWYALWFLPLAAAIESRPLLLASATLAAYYLVLPLANQGNGEVHNYGLALLHALPVWTWLAIEWRRRQPPAGL